MNVMVANSAQHRAMINTVRIFFRKPALFLIYSNSRFQTMKTEDQIQFNLYSLKMVLCLISWYLWLERPGAQSSPARSSPAAKLTAPSKEAPAKATHSSLVES